MGILTYKQPTTFCISNGERSAKIETSMNKINNSAKMKVATTHTLDRWWQTKQKEN